MKTKLSPLAFLHNSMLFSPPDMSNGDGGGEPQSDAWGIAEEESDPNAEADLEAFRKMWSDDDAAAGGNAAGNGNENANSQNQNPQQTQQASPDEVLGNYFKQLNVAGGIDFRKLQEDVLSGNGEQALSEAFNAFGQQMFTHALKTANSVMETRLQKLEQQLDQRINSKQFAHAARQQLEAAIPALTDKEFGPAMRPIVEQAYGRFLKATKGDVPAAIQQTKKYFQRMSGQFADGGNSGQTRPGNSGFGGGVRGNNGMMQTEDTNSNSGMDWDSLLGAPRRGNR